MCFVEVIDDVKAKKNSYISSQEDSIPPKMTPDETSKRVPGRVL